MLKNLYYKSFFALLLFSEVTAQTIDYFPKAFYGNLSGTAGAGLAITDGANAIQYNPAGIVNNSTTETLVYIEGDYYSYRLLNYLHNREVGRTFYQNRIKPVHLNLLFKSQLNKNFGYGIGYTDYLAPYLVNSKRAVTWSPIYNQTTRGIIHSAVLGVSYRLNDDLQIGANISRNWGTVQSIIEGENHYTDLGKTLELETKLSGWQMKIGIQVDLEVLDLGFNLILPQHFITKVDYTISSDSLYKYLIPMEINPTLAYPVNFGIGIETDIFDNWQLLIDVKSYKISESELSFNIYDYGEKYICQGGIGFNSGLIYSKPNNRNISYKLGYGYIPQVCSIYDISKTNDLLGIINTGQNVKHLFTIGNQIHFANIALDYGMKYSFLKWHRNYSSGDWVIEDDYIQQEISLFINILYRSNKKGQV